MCMGGGEGQLFLFVQAASSQHATSPHEDQGIQLANWFTMLDFGELAKKRELGMFTTRSPTKRKMDLQVE